MFGIFRWLLSGQSGKSKPKVAETLSEKRDVYIGGLEKTAETEEAKNKELEIHLEFKRREHLVLERIQGAQSRRKKLRDLLGEFGVRSYLWSPRLLITLGIGVAFLLLLALFGMCCSLRPASVVAKAEVYGVRNDGFSVVSETSTFYGARPGSTIMTVTVLPNVAFSVRVEPANVTPDVIYTVLLLSRDNFLYDSGVIKWSEEDFTGVGAGERDVGATRAAERRSIKWLTLYAPLSDKGIDLLVKECNEYLDEGNREIVEWWLEHPKAIFGVESPPESLTKFDMGPIIAGYVKAVVVDEEGLEKFLIGR